MAAETRQSLADLMATARPITWLQRNSNLITWPTEHSKMYYKFKLVAKLQFDHVGAEALQSDHMAKAVWSRGRWETVVCSRGCGDTAVWSREAAGYCCLITWQLRHCSLSDWVAAETLQCDCAATQSETTAVWKCGHRQLLKLMNNTMSIQKACSICWTSLSPMPYSLNRWSSLSDLLSLFSRLCCTFDFPLALPSLSFASVL